MCENKSEWRTLRDQFSCKFVFANWDFYPCNPFANDQARFLSHIPLPFHPHILFLNRNLKKEARVVPKEYKRSGKRTTCALRKYLHSGYASLGIKQILWWQIIILNQITSKTVACLAMPYNSLWIINRWHMTVYLPLFRITGYLNWKDITLIFDRLDLS